MSAALWCDQRASHGKRAKCLPGLRWCTEGFDTRDLKDAKALLDELAV
jgi:hypothetical protein